MFADEEADEGGAFFALRTLHISVRRSIVGRLQKTYIYRTSSTLIDWALFVHDRLTTINVRALPATARDHLWLLAALGLRPFVHTHGYLERRCLAKALRISPPLYGIEACVVDTATVGEGPDKVVLRGTLWLPKGQSGPFPTIVIRSPYGAQSLSDEWGQMFLAERGYAVLFQDTRGRFGSDGDFLPVEHEQVDGAATVRWVRKQSWCDGRVGVFGPSYLGFTAWAAIGACAPGELQVGVPSITQAVVRPAIFPEEGGVALELLVLWFYLIEVVVLFSQPSKLAANFYRCWRDGRLHKAQMHTPLGNLDEWLVGKPWPFFQSGVREPASDDSPFWTTRSSLCEMRPGRPGCVVPPPLHIVTGLHDFFAPQCLRDYQNAARLQPDTRLTVAPYSHWDLASLEGYQVVIHAALSCVGMHIPPDDAPDPFPVSRAKAAAASGLGASPNSPPPPWAWRTPGRPAEELALPVQVCFLGSLKWRGYRTWPPPSQRTYTLWPSKARTLLHSEPPSPPSPSSSSSHRHLEYIYRPTEPTGTAGGPSFNPLNAGGRSQRWVERRDDVLVFSGAPLSHSLCLAGAAKLTLRVWASARSVDVVARLCRVTSRGVSINLCEGLTRVNAAKGEPSIGGGGGGGSSTTTAAGAGGGGGEEDGGPGRLVVVQMGPLAVELARGESLRLHVCSAAHPRWMRNLCTDPEVPLHEQELGATSCRVRMSVDDADSTLLELPVVDE